MMNTGLVLVGCPMVVPMMLVVRYGDVVVGGIAFIDEWGLANVG